MPRQSTLHHFKIISSLPFASICPSIFFLHLSSSLLPLSYSLPCVLLNSPLFFWPMHLFLSLRFHRSCHSDDDALEIGSRSPWQHYQKPESNRHMLIYVWSLSLSIFHSSCSSTMSPYLPSCLYCCRVCVWIIRCCWSASVQGEFSRLPAAFPPWHTNLALLFSIWLPSPPFLSPPSSLNSGLDWACSYLSKPTGVLLDWKSDTVSLTRWSRRDQVSCNWHSCKHHIQVMVLEKRLQLKVWSRM